MGKNRSRSLATASALGLSLMGAAPSPALEGISSLSIDRDTTVAFNSTADAYTVTVRGSVTCRGAVNISAQIIQYHEGLDFDTASGFTPKPVICPTTGPSTINWTVAARCNRNSGCNLGMRAGAALAVAIAMNVDGKIAQATSEINIKDEGAQKR